MNNKKMVPIDIEEIECLTSRIQAINSLDLSNIIFLENKEIVNIDPKVINEFKYTGLNNIDFITSKFYKGDK